MEIIRHEFSIAVYRTCPASEQVGTLTEGILLRL